MGRKWAGWIVSKWKEGWDGTDSEWLYTFTSDEKFWVGGSMVKKKKSINSGQLFVGYIHYFQHV